jgi:cell division protein FtsB
MNIGCCEIAVVLALANIITLAIFAGYTVKLRTRQLVLEKKNGKELAEIEKLKARVKELEKGGQHVI